jgi:oligopeptide transport system substrate-binding protein
MGGCGETGRRSRLKICFPKGSAGSSPAIRTILGLALAVLTAACGPADDPNRVDISIIGAPPKLGDPDRETLDATRSTMLRETAMGLVRFDASGQIEPALAESWIVTDDGRSIIFRIHRMKWPDGSDVTGQDVAASLNRAIATNSENRLKPLLTAVEAVVGMTGRVVEIRLKTPRPYLLQLLAQPELGIRRNGTGLGPWRIRERAGNAFILRPAPDPYADAVEDAPEDKREIHVKGGRGALAVARFVNETSDLVMNGTAADWPYVVAAGLDDAQRLRRDPVEGLFGLAILPRATFLKERSLREAMAMAIDRPAIATALGVPRWPIMERLLPMMLDSGQAPAAPEWAASDMTERRNLAARRIASWEGARGPMAPVRVALPPGPGMRMLFARLSADWRRIGVPSVLVPYADDDADLRLIDEVAPNNSANWYLTRTGCGYGLACSPVGDTELTVARAAPSLGQRSAAIARADAAYAQAAGYIPIAKPLRWSLVSPVLTRYRDNGFGAHPFAELRVPAKN